MKDVRWKERSVEECARNFIKLGENIPTMMINKSQVELYNDSVLVMRDIARAMEMIGDTGRQALASLMDHRNLAVRTQAATACRDFAREKAVGILSDICELRAGQMSMDAMYALLAIDAFDMKTGPIRFPR
jgi:hypothetical protein